MLKSSFCESKDGLIVPETREEFMPILEYLYRHLVPVKDSEDDLDMLCAQILLFNKYLLPEQEL